MTTEKSLTSVHEALNNAAQSSKHNPPGKPVSFRLEDQFKNEAMAICDRHGTNLSQFLRHCCLGLIQDYSDPSRG